MTTFIQRCIGDIGEEALDGGQIDPEQMRSVLALLVQGSTTIVDTAKTQWALSTAQSDEFDELLTTLPATGVIERAAWAQRVLAMCILGYLAWPGFDSASACRVFMGLSA
jgi:hypothetical protein